MGGVEHAAPEAIGFWESLIQAATGTPEARSIFVPGMMAILSVPMRFIGQLGKMLPDAVLPPELIPVILMLFGWAAGFALGFFTPIPQDIASTIGAGAGLGSKVAHDAGPAIEKHYRSYNERRMKRQEDDA